MADDRSLLTGDAEQLTAMLMKHANSELPERSKRHARMACWLGLLASNWLVVKACCEVGLPTACAAGWDMARSFTGLQTLLLYGALLGFFVDIQDEHRFGALFRRPRCWGFLGAFVLTPAIFSAFEDVHALRGTGPRSAVAVIVALLVGSAACAALAWHVKFAARMPRVAFRAYVLARVVPIACYACYVGAMGSEYALRFQPEWVAFLCAAFCEFNHPTSVIFLAVSLGVFVQGLGAFGDPMFVPERCFRVGAAVPGGIQSCVLSFSVPTKDAKVCVPNSFHTAHDLYPTCKVQPPQPFFSVNAG